MEEIEKETMANTYIERRLCKNTVTTKPDPFNCTRGTNK